MDDKPPFNPVKASFYLVALVIAVQCLVVLIGIGSCLYFSNVIIERHGHCDIQDRLMQIMNQALAAALAFGAGKMSDK
jgi:hypothetical protein